MRPSDLTLGAVFLAVTLAAAAQDTVIDTQRSTIAIHVGKAGLFSAAGHDHTIRTRTAQPVAPTAGRGRCCSGYCS